MPEAKDNDNIIAALGLSEEEAAKVAAMTGPDAAAKEKYKWDDEFQREIVGLLLHEQQFLVQTLPLVKPEYFTNVAHEVALAVAFRHFDKYKNLPTRAQLTQQIKEVLKKDGKGEEKVAFVLGELNTLLNYYVAGLQSPEYYRDKLTNFAKTQALKIAFHKCLEFIKEDPESEETWVKVDDVLNVARNVDYNFDMGLDYFQTAPERYARMKEKIEKGEIFTSGFQAIDDALLGGGLSRGEMAAWMGLSGTGKSLMLVAAALANLAKGKRVLYVTLEIDEDRTAERFDAQLADPAKQHGVKIGNLLEKENIVLKALEDFVADADDKRLMVIKQFPGGAMDVATFRAYYSQIKMHGFKPDLVIIDYVGEMKDYPGIPTHESRYKIVRDLRGFAVEEKICVLTAMQPNRSAKEAIKNGLLIDDESIGDAFAQIKPLDAMWSINQFQEEKEAGLARIFVVKHRFGKSRFVFHVQYDPDTLSIKQISQEKYEAILKRYRMMREKTQAEAMKEEIDRKNKMKVVDSLGNAPANPAQPPLGDMFNGGYEAESASAVDEAAIAEVKKGLPEHLQGM